jgi:hypothetical protein
MMEQIERVVFRHFEGSAIFKKWVQKIVAIGLRILRAADTNPSLKLNINLLLLFGLGHIYEDCGLASYKSLGKQ